MSHRLVTVEGVLFGFVGCLTDEVLLFVGVVEVELQASSLEPEGEENSRKKHRCTMASIVKFCESTKGQIE